MWWHQRSAVKTIVDTGLPIRHLVSGSGGMLLPRDVPFMFDKLGKGLQLTTSSCGTGDGGAVLQSLCNDYASSQRRDTSYTVDVPVLIPPRGTTNQESYTYTVSDTPEYFVQHHFLAPHPSHQLRTDSSPCLMSAALQLIATNLEKEALSIARLDALATGRTITEALAAIHRGIVSLQKEDTDDNSPTTTTSSVAILSPLYNPTEVFIKCMGDALRGWSAGCEANQQLYKILWLPSSQASLSTSLVANCILSALKEVGILEGKSSPSSSSALSIRFAVAHYVDRRVAMQRAANIVRHAGGAEGFVCVGEMDPEPQGVGLLTCPLYLCLRYHHYHHHHHTPRLHLMRMYLRWYNYVGVCGGIPMCWYAKTTTIMLVWWTISTSMHWPTVFRIGY